MKHAYLALGSNIEPLANTARAVKEFCTTRELVAVSTFYRTPAVGHGPSFVNGVIAVQPRDRDVATLLARLRQLEDGWGRQRGPDRNAPRTIDIDLLAWPGHQHERIPHADIERYDFVARPLAELDPHVMTTNGRPVLATARAMLPRGMVPLDGFTRELRRLVHQAKRAPPA